LLDEPAGEKVHFATPYPALQCSTTLGLKRHLSAEMLKNHELHINN